MRKRGVEKTGRERQSEGEREREKDKKGRPTEDDNNEGRERNRKMDRLRKGAKRRHAVGGRDRRRVRDMQAD